MTEFKQCPISPTCRAKVITIGDKLFQRKYTENKPGEFTLKEHKCYAPPPSKAPDVIYMSRWERKGAPGRFRYVGPLKDVTEQLLRAPDVSTRQYRLNGNESSEFTLIGIYRAVPNWEDYTPDQEDWKGIKHRREVYGKNEDELE